METFISCKHLLCCKGANVDKEHLSTKAKQHKKLQTPDQQKSPVMFGISLPWQMVKDQFYC